MAVRRTASSSRSRLGVAIKTLDHDLTESSTFRSVGLSGASCRLAWSGCLGRRDLEMVVSICWSLWLWPFKQLCWLRVGSGGLSAIERVQAASFGLSGFGSLLRLRRRASGVKAQLLGLGLGEFVSGLRPDRLVPEPAPVPAANRKASQWPGAATSGRQCPCRRIHPERGIGLSRGVAVPPMTPRQYGYAQMP